MIQVTGVLVNPFGQPDAGVNIRITSTAHMDSTVVTSFAHYVSGADGSYDFNLVEGTHTVEVKVDDTYCNMTHLIVDDQTPAVMTLGELIAWSPAIVPPPIIPGTPAWDALYQAAMQGEKREYRTQRYNGDTGSGDIKEAIVSDAGRIGRKHTLTEAGEVNTAFQFSSYMDDNNNRMAQSSTSFEAGTATFSDNTRLSTASDGTEEYSRVTAIVASDSVVATRTITVGTHIGIDTESVSDERSERLLDYDFLNLADGLMEIDKTTGTITINGQLVVDAEEFKGPKGDSIYEAYEYSVDGNSNWHPIFQTGDKFRRTSTVTNGEYGPWSPAARLAAEDGAPGDTYYFIYEYSSDQVQWESEFIDGMIWRRERIYDNGTLGDWSDPARIRGADGIPGDTVVVEYQYSINGVSNWHSNFSTGDHYRRERLVTNGVADSWSPATKIVPEKDVDYFDGQDGVIGASGAGFYTIVTSSGAWPGGAAATVAFRNYLGRDPVLDDHLTYTNSSRSVANTFRWNGSSWQAPTMAIKGDLLVRGTITGDRIAAGTITTGNMAANSITSDKIVAGAVTASSLAANAVTTNSLTSNLLIESPHIRSAASGNRLEINGDRLDVYEGTTLKVRIGRL